MWGIAEKRLRTGKTARSTVALVLAVHVTQLLEIPHAIAVANALQIRTANKLLGMVWEQHRFETFFKGIKCPQRDQKQMLFTSHLS